MKDSLYEILGHFSEIESDIECMIWLLETLEKMYDRDSQREVSSCIQVVKAWAKNLERDVAAVCENLEDVLLETKNILE